MNMNKNEKLYAGLGLPLPGSSSSISIMREYTIPRKSRGNFFGLVGQILCNIYCKNESKKPYNNERVKACECAVSSAV